MLRNAIILVGATALAAPISAQTGWVPGAEIVGQSIQVETNGVTNTVYFDPVGSGRIVTPSGTTHAASWTASGGELCLYSGGGKECWPYQVPFQAGQPMTLTSSCQATSHWLASATNPMPAPPPPPPTPAPERG